MSKEAKSQIWRDAKKDFPEFDVKVLGASRYNGGWVYSICHLERIISSKGKEKPEYFYHDLVEIDYWMPIIEPPKPDEQ